MDSLPDYSEPAGFGNGQVCFADYFLDTSFFRVSLSIPIAGELYTYTLLDRTI